MKKVLIITYYWPPSGGAGVQRWLRFVKKLRNEGYEPIVYTVEDPNYALLDEKLEAHIPENIKVLKHKINEPNSFFGKKKEKGGAFKMQQQKGKNRSFVQKASWFIRGNFFIPDARFLWIKPSIKFLSSFLENEKVDLIVSTGPPHSLHLIAEGLKNKFNLPWVADFRDPWTSMDYLDEMFLTKWARKKHAKLEEKVIKSADKIVVVGKTMFNEFKENYGVESEIIYNGYEDSSQVKVEISLDDKFTITHIGSFLKNRNCNDLWEVLSELIAENKHFREQLEIKLIGNVDPVVIESLSKNKLNDNLNLIPYVPYEETQKFLLNAQVLLLPIDRIHNAEFVLTGKLFEYLKSSRPILLVGPVKGDAADIILKCNAGYCCNFDDKEKIKEQVLKMFALFLKKENKIHPMGVSKFSNQELTKKMAGVFNSLTQK